VETGFPPARSPAKELPLSLNAPAGEGRSEKIMLKQQAKAKSLLNLIAFRFSDFRPWRSRRWSAGQ
jgi:hypothetical protein